MPPTTTSTSTRPVPTWPRSATASARHDPRPTILRRCTRRVRCGLVYIMSVVRPFIESEDADEPHFSSVPDLGELAVVSEKLETLPASEAVRWAWDRFGDTAVLAASFQDCVLIDVAMQVAPEIEVVFLDTQYHFAETLWYVERVKERYGLDLRVIEPLIPPDNLWQIDPDECCAMRKVEPLARALEGKSAWLTGLR